MTAKSKLLRMDNVGIVVESLDEAIFFFVELGLKLEGRATVEGEWAGRVTGLGNQSTNLVNPDTDYPSSPIAQCCKYNHSLIPPARCAQIRNEIII